MGNLESLVVCDGVMNGHSHQFTKGRLKLGKEGRNLIGGDVILNTGVADSTMQKGLDAVLGDGMFHGD